MASSWFMRQRGDWQPVVKWFRQILELSTKHSECEGNYGLSSHAHASVAASIRRQIGA